MATMLELARASGVAGSDGVLVRRPCWAGDAVLKIWLVNNKLPEFGTLQSDVGITGRVPLSAFEEYNDFVEVRIVLKEVKANENKRKRSGKKVAPANPSGRTRRTGSNGRKPARRKG